MKTSFELIGIENFLDKLVGFGSDGASVNSGKKAGVNTVLKETNEWIEFGWCVAHRLELSLKDALGGKAFDEIDEILRLYCLYNKSPKKLRELKELVSVYEDSELNEGGCRPKKASGNDSILQDRFLFVCACMQELQLLLGTSHCKEPIKRYH